MPASDELRHLSLAAATLRHQSAAADAVKHGRRYHCLATTSHVAVVVIIINVVVVGAQLAARRRCARRRRAQRVRPIARRWRAVAESAVDVVVSVCRRLVDRRQERRDNADVDNDHDNDGAGRCTTASNGVDGGASLPWPLFERLEKQPTRLAVRWQNEQRTRHGAQAPTAFATLSVRSSTRRVGSRVTRLFSAPATRCCCCQPIAATSSSARPPTSGSAASCSCRDATACSSAHRRSAPHKRQT